MCLRISMRRLSLFLRSEVMSISEGRPPALSCTELVKLINQFYKFESIDANSIKNFPGYDDRNYYFRGIPSLSQKVGDEFVLKMFNELHSTHNVVIGISELWSYLGRKGFTYTGYIPNREGKNVTFVPKSSCPDERSSDSSSSSQTYAVRIVRFISGEVFDAIDKKYITPKLLNEVGVFLGRVDTILKDGFHNTALSQRYIPDWDLQYLPSLRKHLSFIDNSSCRVMVEKILEGFESFVVPKVPMFSKGILHGDPNGMNLIVKKSENGEYQIAGLIDFDDSVCSCYVFDIGILLAYIMIMNLEPVGYSNTVEFVGKILRGYVDVFPLSEDEISCLFHIVLGRCCQSCVLGEISYKAEPWNDYLLITPNKAFRLMELLMAMGKEKVDAIWAKALLTES